MIGKDSGSEAGITGIESNILHRKVRRAEDRRMPRTPFRHSDGSQSLSMPINSISHFWRQKRCKAAFTLAEVLITLGIIGIIAAMTLPSLINKAEKMILKNQFKKTYSILTQALLKSEIDYGSTPECYYGLKDSSATSGITDNGASLECDAFAKIFLKNLNVIATCKNNAYPSCIPKYEGFDTMAIANNPDLSEEEALEIVRGQPGLYQEKILYYNPAYVLADGSIIISYSVFSPKLFAIDINGKKGPNKWGYDLFAFFTARNQKTNLVLIGTPYLVEKGGITTKDMIINMYDDKK